MNACTCCDCMDVDDECPQHGNLENAWWVLSGVRTVMTPKMGGKKVAMEEAAREALRAGEHVHMLNYASNICLNGICS